MSSLKVALAARKLLTQLPCVDNSVSFGGQNKSVTKYNV